MDRSKSTDASPDATPVRGAPVTGRRLTTDFVVGLFAIAGVACAGWLSVGLGGVRLFSTDEYEVIAEFDNVSGLKEGASVEIAGVPIGEVSRISLGDPTAKVTLRIGRAVRIKEDDIASIRTKGIIGDRYVKVSRGASLDHVPEGGTITETESVVDIEDIIGKIVHSLGSGKEEPTTGAVEEPL